MMMAVRFKVGYSPYNAGEVAGFPPEIARRLIQSGVAEEYAMKTMEAPPVDKMVNSALNKASAKPLLRGKRKG